VVLDFISYRIENKRNVI